MQFLHPVLREGLAAHRLRGLAADAAPTRSRRNPLFTRLLKAEPPAEPCERCPRTLQHLAH